VPATAMMRPLAKSVTLMLVTEKPLRGSKSVLMTEIFFGQLEAPPESPATIAYTDQPKKYCRTRRRSVMLRGRDSVSRILG
jgi:hypothetical protein